ncbi:hypothetical protein IJF91_02265 [Candidatus Saccharibacteria bacterium]|nr:hypothetical protein [Candidatus Saccharibacteria bacterium]
MDFSKIENKILAAKTKNFRRVILVYNPRSSKAIRVKTEVLEPLRKIPGIITGKYEVRPTDVDDNAEKLSKLLQDGDIVLTAGGDGTSTIGLNGALLSKKDVRFYALPFGNFNDLPRTIEQASGKEIYPLEAIIDGKHYRYAACYFTIGMFAESTEIFDTEKTRKKLRKGNKGIFFSIKTLANWYFKNKRKNFIPKFKFISSEKTLEPDETKDISDYLAVNGISVAKMMKGGKFYEDKTNFLSTTKKLTSFPRLATFMAKSILKRVPANISTKDTIIFPNGANVEIQAEGEYKKLKHVQEIIIKKSEKSIKIL